MIIIEWPGGQRITDGVYWSNEAYNSKLLVIGQSIGRDSCGHLCRKSLHSQCRYTRQCSNCHWCWDRQIPEIQWPSWQLLLSSNCNRNHWCVWQVHCPLLELFRKETCWHFRRPQGRTVAPPAPVSGHGQREHR